MVVTAEGYVAGVGSDRFEELHPFRNQPLTKRSRALCSSDARATARTIAYQQDDRINRPALTAMLEQIIVNNRAERWRKFKAR